MDDNERIVEITELIAQSNQYGSQKLRRAVKVANEIEDSDDRTSYIAIVAQHLAQIGDLREIDQAIQLIRSTRPVDKCCVFAAITDRLIAEKQYERVLAFLAEIEQSAIEFEIDADFDFSQKADYWSEIGDIYLRLGETSQARDKWSRAADLARMGMATTNPQDAVDSRHALTEITRKLQNTGDSADAQDKTE